MTNTPLKDALADVARDPLNPSPADVITFMQSIAAELEVLGVPDVGSIKANLDLQTRSATADTILSVHNSFRERSDTDFGSTLKIFCLRALTDMKCVSANPSLEYKGKSIFLGLTLPNAPGAENCSISCNFSDAQYFPSAGTVSTYDSNDRTRYPSKRYSWADRHKAVQEFAALLIQYGSPTLSALLRAPEPVTPNPLKTAVQTPGQP